VPVIEGEGIVVIVDLGQVRVGEDVCQDAPAGALARDDVPVGFSSPAAVPALLVLPFPGVADTGLGLDIVEPDVLHALARGPDVLAGHRAGMAADALVEVHHHGDLGADLHRNTSGTASVRTRAVSCANHCTLSSRRTSTISSRLEPMVP